MPLRRSSTSPASFSSVRSCETAGRVTSKCDAISPADSSPSRTSCEDLAAARRGDCLECGLHAPLCKHILTLEATYIIRRRDRLLYVLGHACHCSPRDVQLGRRGPAQGVVPARRLDAAGAAALLRRALRRGRGRLAVLRPARPRRDAALGRADARRVHLPRQGRRRDDLPRGRADRRRVRRLPRARSSRSSSPGSCAAC